MSKRTPHPAMPRATQRGLTLVEIMVSLAIGLVVIGAVLANYLNNSKGSKQSAALAQVTEDATLALGILRNHLAMADFSQPIASDVNGLTRRLAKDINVLGCNNGFTDGTKSNVDASTIRCSADAAVTANNSGALLVRYEADADSLPAAATGPMDCLGSTILANADGVFVADNRFFVAGTGAQRALRCAGNGGTAAADTTLKATQQALVENIEQLQITYGVAGSLGANGRPLAITRYVPASSVEVPGDTVTPGTLQSSWARVVSVRICVIVRSAENVLDQPTRYRDCAGNVVLPPDTDRHIYRAFTSTVVLNNRIGAAAASEESTPPTSSSGGT